MSHDELKLREYLGRFLQTRPDALQRIGEMIGQELISQARLLLPVDKRKAYKLEQAGLQSWEQLNDLYKLHLEVGTTSRSATPQQEAL